MIHHVYANRSNVGDWLSARGMKRLLGGHPLKDHFCDEPFVRQTLAALARTSADDLILIGGGGLFMDYFQPFWDGLLRAPPAAPIVIWGVGLCDLKAERTRPDAGLLRDIARLAARCHVRDALTRDHIGLDHLPEPVACPAVACLREAPLGEAVLHVDNYTTVGAAAFDAMDSEARGFAASIGRAYLRTNNRLEGMPKESDLEAVLDRYRRAAMVLSSALHGCVIAAALGRPVVAVSGDRKIDAFMAGIGLADWVIEPANVARLPMLLERIAEQPGTAEHICAILAANQRIAAGILALIDPPAAVARPSVAA